jgi:hypothetical protein
MDGALGLRRWEIENVSGDMLTENEDAPVCTGHSGNESVGGVVASGNLHFV